MTGRRPYTRCVSTASPSTPPQSPTTTSSPSPRRPATVPRPNAPATRRSSPSRCGPSRTTSSPSSRGALVGRRTRGTLAPPARPAQLPPRSRLPPGRPCHPHRRRGLLRVGGAQAPHRGRMGVRRQGRCRVAALPVGRRTDPGRPAPLQHLAGRLPHAQHRRGRLGRHLPGRNLPAGRPRPVRHGGQRLGVVRRLVRPALLRALARGGPEGPGADRPRRDPGRLVPVTRLVPQPLPHGGPRREHPALVGGELRFPYGRRAGGRHRVTRARSGARVCPSLPGGHAQLKSIDLPSP
jgi:hypothetical protein